MMTSKATYWREGDVWEVELVDEPAVHTFASTLGRARRYIREAAALWYELPVEYIDIEDHIQLPGDLEQRARTVQRSRHIAEEKTAEASEQTQRLIADLLSTGISVRDAAVIVDLSPQRVHQLAKAEKVTPGGTR
jgi:predicted RNase H-like HicB family nuclease